MPSMVLPRLDSEELPVTQLSDPASIDSLLRRRLEHVRLGVCSATENSTAKLPATNTRDAAVAGPALRKAHRKAGAYLALECLSDIFSLDDKPISHMLGNEVHGSQLGREDKAKVVAMMRGGKPVVFRVNSVFPRAWFVHEQAATELMAHHLRRQHAVILVDSVISTGKSIVEFVDHVRGLHPTIHVIVVACVIQAQAIDPECP